MVAFAPSYLLRFPSVKTIRSTQIANPVVVRILLSTTSRIGRRSMRVPSDPSTAIANISTMGIQPAISKHLAFGIGERVVGGIHGFAHNGSFVNRWIKVDVGSEPGRVTSLRDGSEPTIGECCVEVISPFAAVIGALTVSIVTILLGGTAPSTATESHGMILSFSSLPVSLHSDASPTMRGATARRGVGIRSLAILRVSPAEEAIGLFEIFCDGFVLCHRGRRNCVSSVRFFVVSRNWILSWLQRHFVGRLRRRDLLRYWHFMLLCILSWLRWHLLLLCILHRLTLLHRRLLSKIRNIFLWRRRLLLILI
mmetsp:Transcript_2963/g.5873  ORF Transcript_2963/g.5873 Transcript_2963/m.5873 type:complete len:310 (+) Transcript_2963:276-1205(+)